MSDSNSRSNGLPRVIRQNHSSRSSLDCRCHPNLSALPTPERAFRLEHNGRVVLDLPRASTARERALQILGHDAAPHLESFDAQIGETRAYGFVTRQLRFGSRRNQYFFVNGRLVRDRVLSHAANRAYEAFDADGHPVIVLFIDMPCGGKATAFKSGGTAAALQNGFYVP